MLEWRGDVWHSRQELYAHSNVIRVSMILLTLPSALQLLNAYFEAYPEDADKANLCIKGGMVPGTFNVDGTPENARRSIDECLKRLDGAKKLDMFEYGRVDKDVPYETTVGVIAEYVKAGKVLAESACRKSQQTQFGRLQRSPKSMPSRWSFPLCAPTFWKMASPVS